MDHINNSPNLFDYEPIQAMSLREPNAINALSPWDIDFRQIEPGVMKTKVAMRSGSRLTLLKISMSRAVHQTGVSPEGMLTFGLIRPNNVSVWQSEDTSAAELISFGSSDSFDGISANRFCGTTISANVKDVEQLADALGLNVPNSFRQSASPSVSSQQDQVTAVRHNVERLMSSDALPITAEVEETIVAGLLLAANCDEKHTDKSSALTRSKAVSRAIDLILSNLDESIPISRICIEAGVSWRTLDRAFSEKFNIGPKKYYLRIRLNRVRSELVLNNTTESVSDVANRWGFWHLGQFAHDYYCMFGELPSDTARLN